MPILPVSCKEGCFVLTMPLQKGTSQVLTKDCRYAVCQVLLLKILKKRLYVTTGDGESYISESI